MKATEKSPETRVKEYEGLGKYNTDTGIARRNSPSPPIFE